MKNLGSLPMIHREWFLWLVVWLWIEKNLISSPYSRMNGIFTLLIFIGNQRPLSVARYINPMGILWELYIPSPIRTAKTTENRQTPKRKGSSSNHTFSGAFTLSFKEGIHTKELIQFVKFAIHPTWVLRSARDARTKISYWDAETETVDVKTWWIRCSKKINCMHCRIF